MKKVLITGGSGTVGKAFVKNYYSDYEFAVFSRNERFQYELQNEFPKVKCYLGSVEDTYSLRKTYEKFLPEIVVHAAAIKHVHMAERQPIQTCYVNIVGSLNVVQASTLFNVPVTIGISTDKACEHQSVYGISKYMMERCFLEADTPLVRFALCRFANVAHSNGSVIPLWLAQAAEGKPLKVTNPQMNRMMFSPKEASELVKKAVDITTESGGGFVLSKKMKNVNLMQLARCISPNYEIVGERLGEKLNEDLVSETELPYTSTIEDGYIKIGKEVNPDVSSRMSRPYNSLTAESMSDEEVIALISCLNKGV